MGERETPKNASDEISLQVGGWECEGDYILHFDHCGVRFGLARRPGEGVPKPLRICASD